MSKVIIIFGSRADADFAEPLRRTLKELGVPFEQRVASAHKAPEKVLGILKEYESGDELVYITIAGRSNALSGLVDANTKYPVIACPPYSEKFGGANIYSSLLMPSGVAPLVVLEPEAAALAAAKILALTDGKISKKISAYQMRMKEKLEEDDRTLKQKV
jgi:5-(carboxyamino)imidazole ribonucleotide mutase